MNTDGVVSPKFKSDSVVHKKGSENSFLNDSNKSISKNSKQATVAIHRLLLLVNKL